MDQSTSFVRTAKAPVVVLGCGLDTKALSLVSSEGIEAFEIDQAENVVLKREGLRRALTEVPNGLHLISVDFERAGLEQELTRAGFDISRPASRVWEVVTQYLTEDAVPQTMALLSKAAAGSRLAFTYVLADFLKGSQMPVQRLCTGDWFKATKSGSLAWIPTMWQISCRLTGGQYGTMLALMSIVATTSTAPTGAWQ